MSEPYQVRGRGGGIFQPVRWTVYLFQYARKACNFATFPEIYVGAIWFEV